MEPLTTLRRAKASVAAGRQERLVALDAKQPKLAITPSVPISVLLPAPLDLGGDAASHRAIACMPTPPNDRLAAMLARSHHVAKEVKNQRHRRILNSDRTAANRC
jgi:hypothetical protein